MLFRASGDAAAAVCTVMGRVMRIGLAGGELAALKEIETQIVEFAREKGCSAVEIIGRPGWERALNNYKRTAVLLRKDI